MSNPARGEVWLVDLGPVAKIRPALVINDAYGEEDYALCHMIPHTAAVRGSQFEVALTIRGLERGVFNIQGSQSVPPVRLLRRLAPLSPAQLSQVEIQFKRWLGLV